MGVHLTKMNQRARAPTSRTRAAGAAALASVLVTALVVTRESSAVHGTGGPVPWSNWLSSVSLSDSCPEDAHGLMLKQATSNASFWHALHDRTALTVAPVVPVDTSYVRCIEHSIISARIRSELADSETGMPQFLMPLPPLRFSAAKANTRALWLCPTAFLQVSTSLKSSSSLDGFEAQRRGIYAAQIVHIASLKRPTRACSSILTASQWDTLEPSSTASPFMSKKEGRPSESQTPRSAVICRACRDFGTRIASSAGMRAARAVYKRRGRRCQR